MGLGEWFVLSLFSSHSTTVRSFVLKFATINPLCHHLQWPKVLGLAPHRTFLFWTRLNYTMVKVYLKNPEHLELLKLSLGPPLGLAPHWEPSSIGKPQVCAARRSKFLSSAPSIGLFIFSSFRWRFLRCMYVYLHIGISKSLTKKFYITQTYWGLCTCWFNLLVPAHSIKERYRRLGVASHEF